MYCAKPCLSDEEADQTENYLRFINAGDFVGMQPRFSDDYTRLAFVASEDKILSRSGSYQLKSVSWPCSEGTAPTTVIDYHKAYPSDEDHFAGIYGHK